ncbi:MFS family permease [Actinoalloteichus hoggarensis]|nr:MFS family permease [Actinoalloteichus hoggarensis]
MTARFARTRLLVGGLAVFALVDLMTMFATSYAAPVALRIAAALVAAAVSPVAFAVAGALAPAGRQGRSIGAVAAGLTISLVVGVPIGSRLGGVFDWQATFGFVALLTALAVAITALTLPTLPAVEEIGVRARLALLRAPAVLTCVVGTIIGACGGLMPYTLIAPVVDDLAGVGQAWLPVLIAGYGVAGAVGTVLGGRLNDSWATGSRGVGADGRGPVVDLRDGAGLDVPAGSGAAVAARRTDRGVGHGGLGVRPADECSRPRAGGSGGDRGDRREHQRALRRDRRGGRRRRGRGDQRRQQRGPARRHSRRAGQHRLHDLRGTAVPGSTCRGAVDTGATG